MIFLGFSPDEVVDENVFIGGVVEKKKKERKKEKKRKEKKSKVKKKRERIKAHHGGGLNFQIDASRGRRRDRRR